MGGPRAGDHPGARAVLARAAPRRRGAASARDHPLGHRLGVGLPRPPRPPARPPDGPRTVGRHPSQSPGRRRPVRRRGTRRSPTREAPIASFWADEASIGRLFDETVRAVPLDAWELGGPDRRLDVEGPRGPPGGVVRRGRRGARTSTAAMAAGGRVRLRASTPGMPERCSGTGASRRPRRSTDTTPAGRGCRPRSMPRIARRPPRSGGLELGVRGPARSHPRPPGHGRPVVRAYRLAERRGGT